MVKEKTKILMKDIMEDPRSGDRIVECEEAVENIIERILDNGGIVSDLLTTDRLDSYIYTHSVNVSVMSVGLAIMLGSKKNSDLISLGMGSLLHDIGKSTISPELIHKPAKRMTALEKSIIAQHVIEGGKLLKHPEGARLLFNDVPREVFYPVLQHHELLSGNGYPGGFSDKNIHLYGRITAITNLYDNLTSNLPSTLSVLLITKRALDSNQPLSEYKPFEAMNIIKKAHEDYDSEITKEFIKMIGSIS